MPSASLPGVILLLSAAGLACHASLLSPTDFVVQDLETAELRIPGEALADSKPGQELGDWVLSRPNHEDVRAELAPLGRALEEEHYEDALDILRAGPIVAFEEIDRRLWEARIQIELEHYPEAERILHGLEKEERSADPRIKLLRLLSRIESGKAATGVDGQAEPFPRSLPLDPWLIRVFAGSKGTPESELLLVPLREADVNGATSAILCDAAAHLFDYGDFEGAGRMARRALKVDPEGARGHFLLGSSLLAERRFEDARNALLKSVRLRPDHSESFTNLAAALHKLGEKEEGLLMQILSMESKIDFPEGWTNYLILLNRNLLPNQALAKLPDPPEGHRASPAKWHWQAALSAMEEGDAEASTGHFLRSLSHDLNNPNTHNDFAVLLTQLDRKALALPFLRAAAFLSPDSKVVSENLKSLVQEVRELAYQPLIEEMNRKLAIRDDAENRGFLAELLEQVGRKEEAIEQWRIAMESDPDGFDHRFALSQALSRAGLFGEALATFRPILEADPANPEWRFRTAWLLLQLPDPSEATLDQAVEHATRACESTEYQHRRFLTLLAAALSARGKEEQANGIRHRLEELGEARRDPN